MIVLIYDVLTFIVFGLCCLYTCQVKVMCSKTILLLKKLFLYCITSYAHTNPACRKFYVCDTPIYVKEMSVLRELRRSYVEEMSVLRELHESYVEEMS